MAQTSTSFTAHCQTFGLRVVFTRITYREEILWEGEKSHVREESPRLAALKTVNRAIIEHVQSRNPLAETTIDIDAVILESDRREAEWTYKGVNGYQPVVSLWAEQDLVLDDEYREGNVPAGSGNRRVIEKSFEQHPTWVTTIRLRADSACYEEEVLRFLEEKGAEYTVVPSHF